MNSKTRAFTITSKPQPARIWSARSFRVRMGGCIKASKGRNRLIHTRRGRQTVEEMVVVGQRRQRK